MISSTAARSGMTLKYCRSFKHSLQLQCLLALSRSTFWPEKSISVFKCHDLPPGLKRWAENNYWWVTCKEGLPSHGTTPRIITQLSDQKENKKPHGVRRKVGNNEEKSLPTTTESKRLRLRSLGGSTD